MSIHPTTVLVTDEEENNKMKKKTLVPVPLISLGVLVGLAWAQSSSVPKAANQPANAQLPRQVSKQVLRSTTIENKGYRIAGDDLLMQRLVHLVDEVKRNELMIIYIEDLSELGFTAADLAPGGRAAGRSEEISIDLLERAQKGLKVERLGSESSRKPILKNSLSLANLQFRKADRRPAMQKLNVSSSLLTLPVDSLVSTSLYST